MTTIRLELKVSFGWFTPALILSSQLVEQMKWNNWCFSESSLRTIMTSVLNKQRGHFNLSGCDSGKKMIWSVCRRRFLQSCSLETWILSTVIYPFNVFTRYCCELDCLLSAGWSQLTNQRPCCSLGPPSLGSTVSASALSVSNKPELCFELLSSAVKAEVLTDKTVSSHFICWILSHWSS